MNEIEVKYNAFGDKITASKEVLNWLSIIAIDAEEYNRENGYNGIADSIHQLKTALYKALEI